MSEDAINIIFDGPPDHESGRFVEVETDDGRSVRVGEWIERDYGLWALRIECWVAPAPTNIKWEDGQSPVPSGTEGTVFSNTSRPYIKMNDGRWAWMP